MKNKFWFLLGFVFLFTIKENAQSLVANFTSKTSKGCNPLTVEFKNLSTPSSGLNYFWDFGNGATSITANPIILFTKPGIYSVKLIISDGTNSDSIIKQNYIYPPVNRIKQSGIDKSSDYYLRLISKIASVPLEVKL